MCNWCILWVGTAKIGTLKCTWVSLLRYCGIVSKPKKPTKGDWRVNHGVQIKWFVPYRVWTGFFSSPFFVELKCTWGELGILVWIAVLTENMHTFNKGTRDSVWQRNKETRNTPTFVKGTWLGSEVTLKNKAHDWHSITYRSRRSAIWNTMIRETWLKYSVYRTSVTVLKTKYLMCRRESTAEVSFIYNEY